MPMMNPDSGPLDKTFMGAGKVGLWTKADSVTYFDDLHVGPLTNM